MALAGVIHQNGTKWNKASAVCQRRRNNIAQHKLVKLVKRTGENKKISRRIKNLWSVDEKFPTFVNSTPPLISHLVKRNENVQVLRNINKTDTEKSSHTSFPSFFNKKWAISYQISNQINIDQRSRFLNKRHVLKRNVHVAFCSEANNAKQFYVTAHFQGATMWKLTSRCSQKCGVLGVFEREILRLKIGWVGNFGVRWAIFST